MKLVVAITGASGIPIAKRLLEFLASKNIDVQLIVSEAGLKVIKYEGNLEELEKLAKNRYSPSDFEASVASGSSGMNGMVIVPCSMKTLAAVALGLELNLITRAAGVCLKQEKPLILVPRETPMNRAHLKNLLLAKENGASIVLPVLTFYTEPKTIQDQVDFVVGRIVELLGMEHDLYKKWR